MEELRGSGGLCRDVAWVQFEHFPELLSDRDAGELKGCLVRLSVVAGGAWHHTNNLDISTTNAPPELSINSQIVDKQE
jgi:hypothetical protein